MERQITTSGTTLVTKLAALGGLDKWPPAESAGYNGDQSSSRCRLVRRPSGGATSHAMVEGPAGKSPNKLPTGLALPDVAGVT